MSRSDTKPSLATEPLIPAVDRRGARDVAATCRGHAGRRGRNRGGLLVVVAAALALTVAGCGGDDVDAEGNAGAGEVTQIDVGHLEVVTVAPLLMGIEKGFFEQEGLDVRPRAIEAPATIPAVVSGDLDLAFTGPPPTLLAKSNGLPIKAVAPAAVAADREAIVQLVVPKDSGIDSLNDLAGKKIAVDGLFQLPHIAMLRAAKSQGADPSKWDVKETPYPTMVQTLASGKVDAAVVGEPFLSQALAQGNKSVAGIYEGWEVGTPFSLYVSSDRFVSQNADAAQRFSRAMAKANRYANENQTEVRKFIPTFLEMPAEVARKIRLPVFSENLDVNGLERWKAVMDEEGVLKKDVDVSELVDGSK